VGGLGGECRPGTRAAGDSIRRGAVPRCGRKPGAGSRERLRRSPDPRAAARRVAVRGVVCGLTDVAECPSGC